MEWIQKEPLSSEPRIVVIADIHLNQARNYMKEYREEQRKRVAPISYNIHVLRSFSGTRKQTVTYTSMALAKLPNEYFRDIINIPTCL